MKKVPIHRMVSILLLFGVMTNGCVKDKDYEYANAYQLTLKSILFNYSKDSLPADGNSKLVIDIAAQLAEPKDTINVSKTAISLTTTNGIFVESGTASYTVTPSYKLDTLTSQKILTAKVTLQSSTKVDTAKIIIKYAGVEQQKNIIFYRAYPNKIKLSASTYQVSPNFLIRDTITAQLSSATGLPSQGTPVGLDIYDDGYTKKLGLFISNPTQSNTSGKADFVFVLGDNAINGVNYIGTIHLVGRTQDLNMPYRDTLTIYSRN